MKKSLALSMTITLPVLMLLSALGSAMAQDNRGAPRGQVPMAPSPARGPTDPAELAAFLDDLFAKQMAEYHIAGAAVSVVKDGKLFFTKGYGYADLDEGVPVDPERTIFRIGSVGKLFTWTAVMQLVEQGKLDLDADINTYLDFHIPDTYPQPITLKHLLTHTSGFEDRQLGSVVSDASDLGPRTWRTIHGLSYTVFGLGLVHAVFSGTDSPTIWAGALYWGTGVSVLALMIYRLLLTGMKERKKAATGPVR